MKVCRSCGVEIPKPEVRDRKAFLLWLAVRHCAPCRPIAKRQAQRRGNLTYTAARYARYRRVGGCGWCGVPTAINPETGQPFALCFDHRLRDTTCTKARQQRRAGVAYDGDRVGDRAQRRATGK